MIRSFLKLIPRKMVLIASYWLLSSEFGVLLWNLNLDYSLRDCHIGLILMFKSIWLLLMLPLNSSRRYRLRSTMCCIKRSLFKIVVSSLNKMINMFAFMLIFRSWHIRQNLNFSRADNSLSFIGPIIFKLFLVWKSLLLKTSITQRLLKGCCLILWIFKLVWSEIFKFVFDSWKLRICSFLLIITSLYIFFFCTYRLLHLVTMIQ